MKPRSRETKKPRNQGTKKPRRQWTKKPKILPPLFPNLGIVNFIKFAIAIQQIYFTKSKCRFSWTSPNHFSWLWSFRITHMDSRKRNFYFLKLQAWTKFTRGPQEEAMAGGRRHLEGWGDSLKCKWAVSKFQRFSIFKVSLQNHLMSPYPRFSRID